MTAILREKKHNHLQQAFNDALVIVNHASSSTSMMRNQLLLACLRTKSANVRSVVLMDEYNTILTCSECNSQGVGLNIEQHELYDRNNSLDTCECEDYPLWGNSRVQAAPLGAKARQKPHEMHHFTCAMMPFRRTVIPNMSVCVVSDVHRQKHLQDG
jgi:hypothetical protein